MYKFDKLELHLLFVLFFLCGVLFSIVTFAVVSYTKTERFLCVDGVLLERKANDIFENTGKRCLRMNDEKE